MKLSISNIAWTCEQDETVYTYMKQYGFTGLEIAPTRWISSDPYSHIIRAREIAADLRTRHNLGISSIQSIWYGKTENIWDVPNGREALFLYTQRAIDFAQAVNCGNLVLGCPKNRNKPEGAEESGIAAFFSALGEYALTHGTVLAMEPNPPIYHTNYINTTREAIELIKRVGSAGFGLNLDTGTMIENGETPDVLDGALQYVNHVHISEPFLEVVKNRQFHRELRNELWESGYKGYVSIEMNNKSGISAIMETMAYVAEVFG